MIIASVPTGGRKQSPPCDSSKRNSDVLATKQAQRVPSPAKTRDSSVDFYSSPLRLQQIAHQRIQYPAFRESFFYDETVNHVLKGDGWEPDPKSAARESKKEWSSRGRSISSRLPKTAVPPGSAFRNECVSPDRLYSSSRGSLGYEITRSLRGSSLCSSTKRFDAHADWLTHFLYGVPHLQKTATSESVGPGSYNTMAGNRSVLHVPGPDSSEAHTERLREWGNAPADPRQMDSADEWKLTSEKPSPTNYSFRRAPGLTWIEQVEQRQRRFDPHAREPPATLKSPAEQRMPSFLHGVRNPVHTKHATLLVLTGNSPPSPKNPGSEAELPRSSATG